MVSFFIGVGLALTFIAFDIHPRDLAHRLQNRFNPTYEIRTTLSLYFNAWQAGQPQKMYAQLSALDKSEVKLERFIAEFKELPSHPKSWKIMRVRTKHHTAIATVSLTWPFLGHGDQDMTQEQVYVLIKEKGHWKISEKATFE